MSFDYNLNPVDPDAPTRPMRISTPPSPGAAWPYQQSQRTPSPSRPAPIESIQPVRVPQKPVQNASRAKRPGRGCCLGPLAVILIAVLGVAALYFLAPLRTNILVLGLDARPDQGETGRTDTIILVTVNPLRPYVGMLSIPRDLWVPIPGHGENRINTAHFFAEAEQPGSGPAAAAQVVEDNFQVPVNYYVRARFDSFVDVVDAMGGVDITLDQPASGFPAGKQHWDGTQALAFVRERESSDDFYRMAHGQLLLKAVAKQLLSPLSWPRLPAIASALFKAVDTNIPAWQWPRLALALVRVGPDGIDNRTLTRDEVTPYITSEGADVLLPNWDKIRPIVSQMFGG